MNQPEYLSITELAILLNSTLEEGFPRIYFEGEISQVKKAASGHYYFTLKDTDSQLPAAMWQGYAKTLKFIPEEGLAVLCVGKPNLYTKSGRFQMIVQRMALSGEGDLRKKFLQLKDRLEKEGFFDEGRKRPLPFMPKAVGVVTSKTGAAIHDIMVKIRERMPQQKVYLVDARVQGPGAAEDVARGIKLLSESNLVDVIIAGRGGGSLEDLWCFNEEVVVKAIFASRVPVISAVGHEVDVSLSDLAADRRSPTPTAAAELVVPDRVELLEKIAENQRRLSDYERWLYPRMQDVDILESKLSGRLDNVLHQSKLNFSKIELRLKAIRPDRLFGLMSSKIDLLEQRIKAAALSGAESAGNRLSVLEGKLESMSHKKVMARGYSIVRKGDSVISDIAVLKSGDLLQIDFSKGKSEVKVEKVIKEKNNE